MSSSTGRPSAGTGTGSATSATALEVCGRPRRVELAADRGAAVGFIVLPAGGGPALEAGQRPQEPPVGRMRPEERRVGKEFVSPCLSRGAPYHYKITHSPTTHAHPHTPHP